ncbi:MAG: preprotein translocase subunit SecG [Roseateles depolymerans]|uniref:Protein-export membrane protein SecG n=1 Tax=Roseateles depolymerans TaxID=76731 RepID=A0A2W5DDF9_9BURK|nr:MAG: preprotein translocase subunit SecG [Roseateles depolymerans]
MQFFANLVLIVQLLSALAIIGLVLVQHGKGADMGASFGSGASGSLFGATGSANFLSRSTAVAATLFFGCTLALAFLANGRTAAPASDSILDRAAVVAPAATASGAAAIPGAAVVAPAASAASQ